MGAPQAAGQGPLRGSRPGALFRCPITPEEYDCERVDIDGEGECAVEELKRLADSLGIRKHHTSFQKIYFFISSKRQKWINFETYEYLLVFFILYDNKAFQFSLAAQTAAYNFS